MANLPGKSAWAFQRLGVELRISHPFGEPGPEALTGEGL
jgi:hypothetical protein